MALFSSKRDDIARRQGILLSWLALSISLLSALLAYHHWPESLNWLHYDQTQQYNRLPSADEVVIVEIDDKSLAALGHWPWPRATHATLLTQLGEAGVKAIVFDVLFPNADHQNTGADLAFAQAIAQRGNVILPLYFEALGPQGVIVESPPYAPFYEAAAAIGHIHFETDSDGVVRAVTLKQGINTAFWPHLALAALQHTAPASSMEVPGKRADSEQPNVAAIHLAKDYYNLLPMPAATQGIRHFSYSDVLHGNIDSTYLHNKIVFIGATATGLGDVLATPVGSMHGVELNAWTFQALRHQQFIETLQPAYLAALTFALVLAALLFLGRLSPKLLLTCSAGAVVAIVALSSLLLLHMQVWLPCAAAALGIALFFPLWSWLRAESMLRYLREEVAELSLRTLPTHYNAEQKQLAIGFLSQLGFIEAQSLQATATGKQSVGKLASRQATALPEAHFWHEQINRYEHAAKALNPDTGFDLITRTLGRLNAVREQDQKNRQLIEQSLSGLQDAVCIADICGQITYTNTHFKQWFMPAPSSSGKPGLLGLLDTLRLKSGRNWPRALQSLYLSDTPFYDEAVFRNPNTHANQNDRQFLCQISLVNTGAQFRDTLVLAFTDITQLKAAENARAEALSFLSHDLRSPMVSVLAILERHRDANQPMPAQERKNIETLVRKNLDYAEAFLQLSKAETLPENAMEPCDLHAVLDAAHAHALALASPKAIVVQVARCNEDAWVRGDISLLERAMNNLVSNAIKYSPAHATVHLTLACDRNTLTLSVSDLGPGIPAADQPHLFKRFTRSQQNQSHGIGLGLNFVATVVNKHGGDITVDSQPGKGATFTMQFPALSAQEIALFFSAS